MKALELSGYGEEDQVVMPKRRRGRKAAVAVADRPTLEAKPKIAWQDVPELRALRDPDALYEEFVKRKAEDNPKRIAALLYAAMKFPQHPEAMDMLNCCAYNRAISAQRTAHLVQALRGFTLGLKIAKRGELRWKIALNRLVLLNQIGVFTATLRQSGWLFTELPTSSPLYPVLCSAMGTAYGSLGRYGMAAIAYERAVSLMGDFDTKDRLTISWARATLRSGEYERAQEIASLVRSQESGRFLALEADFAFQKRDWHAFIAKAKQALLSLPALTPFSWDRLILSELHFQFAHVYHTLGDKQLSAQHAAAGRAFSFSVSASFGASKVVPIFKGS